MIICAQLDEAWREICYGSHWCWRECVPSVKSFLLGHRKKLSKSSLMLNSESRHTVWVMCLGQIRGGWLGGPCPVSDIPADWFLWSGLRNVAEESPGPLGRPGASPKEQRDPLRGPSPATSSSCKACKASCVYLLSKERGRLSSTW